MRPPKQRCLRSKLTHEVDDSDEEVTSGPKAEVPDASEVAASILELQRLRKRPQGIGLEALRTGKAIAMADPKLPSDPFKLKTGGLVNMRSIVESEPTEEEDDVEARLARTFASETNKRDEDAEMLKYIEEELAKRKGIEKEIKLPKTNEESNLFHDVPDLLKPAIGQQKEDMLSNQMLCGIPEVDLGVEAKMRNIESTEEAKQMLLKQRFNRRHGLSMDGMAPMNVSVNFVQHSRWNNQASVYPRREADRNVDSFGAAPPILPALVKPTVAPAKEITRLDVERQRLQTEKATDSIALQRFKNYMRDRRRR